MNKILQYRNLILAVAAALLFIGLSGYLFAEKKSEPVYLSKIDQLMFDNNNKSPKFVITLPDRKKAAPKEAPKKEDNKPQKAEITEEPNPQAAMVKEIIPPKPEKEPTLDDILAQAPSVLTLPAKPATQNLAYITLNEKLSESKGALLLPAISKDGRQPWIEYGKTVNVQPNFKKVAIVIKGSGFDAEALDKITKAFDSEVSFSFSPYAPETGTKILSARQQGHETYMDLPLSSKDFLKSDSGPLSMSLTISDAESLNRLEKILSPGAPIGGVVINDGVADESNEHVLQIVLRVIKRRGLLMIDATHGDGIERLTLEGLPRRRADIIIDNLLDRELIRQEIAKAEKTALENGQVLIVAEPKPVILKEIHNWINTFSPQLTYEASKNTVIEKPLALVPVSNLVVE